MKWFDGSIADAVSQSKQQQAIFVVYVEGKDENSLKLNRFLDEPLIKDKLQTDNFVAIKIQSGSDAYLQFASIYQVVPVPSIFFIGKSGNPLEVVTGLIGTVEEFDVKIIKLLETAGKSSTSSATVNGASASKTSDNDHTQKINECQDENCKNECNNTSKDEELMYDKKPIVAKTSEEKTEEKTDLQTKSNDIDNSFTEASTSQPSSPLLQEANQHTPVENDKAKQEKIEDIRKYLEEQRCKRIEEEQRLEKERELKRRQDSKVMQNFHNWQQDQQLKELQENIKREKMEEQLARERIRAQIAADRAERATRFSQVIPAASTSANNPVDVEVRTPASDETRLQFRFPNGQSKNHVFKCSAILAEVKDYVTVVLLPGTGIRNFILATTYPKREFSDDDYSKTLMELGLAPSAVILVLVKDDKRAAAVIAHSGNILNLVNSIIWSMVNPIIAVMASVGSWVQNHMPGRNSDKRGAQKRVNDNDIRQKDSVKRRNSGPSNSNNTDKSDRSNNAYRRYTGNSNVHRLSDNRGDSDDENATWNGNSTQQQ